MRAAWRDVDHVREARISMRSGREPPAVTAANPLRDSFGHTRRGTVVAGDKYGELTAIECRGRDSHLGYRWLFRCDCGRSAIRLVARVRHNVRNGRSPACASCVAEARRGYVAIRYELLREAFRQQFVDKRTLWTGSQTARLMDAIQQDLVTTFGEPREEDWPMPVQYEAGYPFSHDDLSIAKEGIRRWRRKTKMAAAGDDWRRQWFDDDVQPLSDDESTSIAALVRE
jgi:hypothetical protein